MDPVRKALWFVEAHSREVLSLEDIAAACKVSPFHLTRVFAASTGLSLMRYVRARRLSQAALQLAREDVEILPLALEAGYGSHEAFTRAFVEQFARTPEQVRSQGHTNNLSLVREITMESAPASELAPPRFETLKPMVLAGLVDRLNCQQPPTGISDQWQRFAPHIGRIPGQTGYAAYGACYNFDRDGNFDYMCAVEITGAPDLPKGMTTLAVPQQKYVVFTHRGHVAGIRSTISAIYGTWFPESGHKPAEAPMLERYGSEFNPRTGMGAIELWIPIECD
jgi:AraC family transcriptional regulator